MEGSVTGSPYTVKTRQRQFEGMQCKGHSDTLCLCVLVKDEVEKS